MATQLLRRLFTVKEYHQMAEAGILTEQDRVELIRGEIVQMSPIGRRHAACVARITQLFNQRLGNMAIVWPQNPITLQDNSEPQPDITLLTPRPDFYESGHPQASDIFFLVEVADATVQSDREEKLPLYAENGITEVWLVNLNEQYVEVYRNPTADRYQAGEKYERGQTLAIQTFPKISFSVNERLG